MWTDLILNAHSVADLEGWEPLCVFSPPFLSLHVSLAESFFSFLEGVLPCWMWLIATRHDGDEILDGATEDAHGWGDLGLRIWSVPVLEHSGTECVGVQCAGGRCV